MEVDDNDVPDKYWWAAAFIGAVLATICFALAKALGG